jgi:hypothetical protein
MDLQKAKILLEKINALYKSMGADAKNISSIERDLMRSYVQQFYEVFMDMPASAIAPEAPPVEIIKSTPKITLNKPEPAPKAPEPPVVEPDPEPEPAPPAREVKPEPVKVATPPPPPVQKETPAPAPAPAQPRPQPAPRVVVNEELEELFAFGSAMDLSEKLSELPITDIKKAMGLNERIFTVNELFGGSQADFDETLNELGRLRNFEEAKNYLIQNAAGKYNWAAKDRKSKAKTFIKLVKRRFN